MNKIVYNLIFFVVILLSSCKPEYIDLKGSICGNVFIYNENGEMLPHETITVSIKVLGLSVNTNSDGYYILNEIPAGTYNVSFKSISTSEHIKRGVQIAGSENPILLNPVNLSVKSNGIVSNLHFDPSPLLTGIAGNINPSGNVNEKKKINLYSSTNSIVSKENYQFFETFEAYADSFVFYPEIIQNAYLYGINQLYFVAYMSVNNEHDWNCDEYNMNCVDPGCSDSPSNIISLNFDKKE
jgi:hypothetical protein